MNVHMLDWWHKHQPQAKLITMGTSCAYDPAYPLEEAYYLSGTPIDSLFAYGMTKRMLLCGLQSLQKQYGLNYLFIIPSTLYGIEGYHTDGKQLHFIFDVIRKILRGKFYGERVVLWGDGEQKREIVHVNDFVDAMLKLAEKENNQTINIGAGGEYSIKQFAEMVCDEIGYPFSQIIFDTTRYVGARSKVLNNGELMKILPSYAPRAPREGIKEIISWLVERKDLL
jgi:GDP-L-fucose synthase